MSWPRRFEILQRINSVGNFAVLVVLLVLGIVWLASGEPGFDDQTFEDDAGKYGTKSDRDAYRGEEIKTLGGGTVSYVVKPLDEEGMEVSGRNVSLTNRTNGKSRLVLPDGGSDIVLNWRLLEAPDDDELKIAYVALTGTRQDYKNGFVDLIVGRLPDLSQATLAKQLRFVDAPQMIDRDTLSLIAWTGADSAEFWLVDLRKLAIETKRPISLPLPQAVGQEDLDLEEASDAVAAAVKAADK